MTKVLLLCAALAEVAACTHAGGMVMGDTMTYDKSTKKWTALVEYKAPDIDELTGIDPDAPKVAPTPMTIPAAETTPPPAAPVAEKPATPPAAKPATPPAKPATPPAKPATPAKK